jgi:hypothetical protein
MKMMIKKVVALLLGFVVGLANMVSFAFAFAEDGEVEYIPFAVAKEMFEDKFGAEVRFRLQYVTEADGKEIISSYFSAEASVGETYVLRDMRFIYIGGKNTIGVEDLFEILPLKEEIRDETFFDETRRVFCFVFDDESGSNGLVEKTQFEGFLAFCEELLNY